MLMSEDKQLLKRMRCGDKDALRQVYEKYRDDLFTVAVSLLRDVHASEDCLQDVFVGFADAVDGFNIRHNLKGYLISCVANQALDRLRKQTTQLDCPLEELSCMAISSDPANEVIDYEELGQVFEALVKLPYEQREVFVLHVQGELKFGEIAKLQNVSIKTTQSRYRYAIEKLRALLGKENTHEVRK
jgi:RNA polymerase sigma-70 factor (ECF subfamily)